MCNGALVCARRPSFLLDERPVNQSNLQKQLVRMLIDRADAARDSRAFSTAAALFEAALEVRPDHAGLHMQAGHMYKEACNFEAAEQHYQRVLMLTPEDPEIHLQLGHFYKTCGRLPDARSAYQQAIDLRSDWDVPREELKSLSREMDVQTWEQGRASSPNPEHLQIYDVSPVFINKNLFPKEYADLLIEHGDAVVLKRVGNYQKTRWGEGNTVRNIDAVRGYFISKRPMLWVDIYVDGQHVKREPLVPGRERREKTDITINKYAFNAWIDFSKFSFGWHEIVVRAEDVTGVIRDGANWARERFIVAEPLREDAFPESDGWVAPFPADAPGTLEEQINGLPSVVRRSSSRSIPVEPNTILVQRLDQLGDMAVSEPALRRLRELVPDAKIIGMLSPANADLGRTLGVFDEVLVFDFPDDPVHEDRILDRDGQLEYARILAPYNLDVAFDLSCYGTTRQLLPLTGAPLIIGFGHEAFMTFSVGLSYNEGRSRREFLRHAGATRMLVEGFAALLDSGARVVRREDLDRAVLEVYGIGADDDFVVLHAGSRIKFTRWPYFADVAERLLHETNVKVVIMAEDGALEAQLSGRRLDKDRLIFITGKIPFDHFDALASFCSSFVGNDSGPKHLAGLRGANVVGLHSARQNGTEWSQSPAGVSITRNVPCAGCALHHNPEECAKGVVCITGISVEEVLREVLRVLP